MNPCRPSIAFLRAVWLVLLASPSLEAVDFELLWRVGIDNGTQSDFSQENGFSNPPPGSATVQDDDYYFAGDYPSPVDLVPEDEEFANFDRALTDGDPRNRIHFIFDPVPKETDEFRLTVDAIAGLNAFSFFVLFNDTPVAEEFFDSTDQIYTVTFTASQGNAVQGENIVTLERELGAGGWIQFDHVSLEFKEGENPDMDGDGLSDSWEFQFFPGDLTQLSGSGDFDNDGLTDGEEFNFATDPTLADTDSDGLDDNVETNTGVFVDAGDTGTDANDSDTDGDGISDGDEVNSSPPTNPNLIDTDGDGFSDQTEITEGTSPTDPTDSPQVERLIHEGVVINEIHYHPSDAQVGSEFIELLNTSTATVDVSGWSFVRGIDFTLPSGVSIPPSGYLVVAKDPDTYVGVVPPMQLVGGFISSLANGGETLELVDAEGMTRDKVRYDDRYPWSTAADGLGASLERICPESPGAPASNWTSGLEPTPGAVNNDLLCPRPDYIAPSVVINEILYHHPDDIEAAEYVELHNTTNQPIDVSNWSFTAGIAFTIPGGTQIPPRGYLVVAKDAAYLTTNLGVANVVGDYAGDLANSGERVELSDNTGQPVDSVRYKDGDDWPPAADGLGFSLEKVVPTADGTDPASWRSASTANSDFELVQFEGTATSSRLYLYLESPGELLVDNVSLVPVANPGQERIPGGDFNANSDGWNFTGNHDESRYQTTGGVNNTGCVRIISAGVGGSSTNSMNRFAIPDLVQGDQYRLRFHYRLLSGNGPLVARLSQSTEGNGLFRRIQVVEGSLSPGFANTVLTTFVPPFVSRTFHTPREPFGQEMTTVTAHVRGEVEIDNVTLRYTVGGGFTSVTMFDDGGHEDGLRGDGIYGVQLDGFPHNTLVRYTILATNVAGQSQTFPESTDPSREYAYYVNDDQPSSPLPVYHILGGPVQNLGCSLYATRHFVSDGEVFLNVGVRNRGQSQCGQTKRNLKVRFNRGRYFLGQRKLNFNSLWPDKSLLRDKLSWDTIRDQNHMYCESYHVRLHHDGEYHGLFLAIEHPDKFMLDRLGLDPNGNLYKAVANANENVGGLYEKKTNEDGDFSDLTQFLGDLNNTPSNQMLDWVHENINIEWQLDFQASVVGSSSVDHLAGKNHYLYHEPTSGRWRLMNWDLELTYGAFWDRNNNGLYNDQINITRVGLTYGITGGNRMLTRMFDVNGPSGRPYFDRAYYARLWAHFREKTNEAVTGARVEELRTLLADEQAEDIAKWGRFPPVPDPSHPADFDYNVDELLDIGEAAGTGFLRRRMNWLRDRLDGTGFSGFPWVRITEIMYNPQGASEDLEFLELNNTEDHLVDISGWTIEAVDYEFPNGTVLAEHETIVVVKNVAAFQGRYGAVGARVFGPYSGNLDNDGERVHLYEYRPGAPEVGYPQQHPITVDFVAYRDLEPWPILADGEGPSLELIDLALDNDLPGSWTASQIEGGTPGRLSQEPSTDIFIRGDSNTDGSVDIADAVEILFGLFGGSILGCRRAADANDSGVLDVTDVMVVFGYLFLGEASPPAPFPSCGLDTTPDTLDCSFQTSCAD